MSDVKNNIYRLLQFEEKKIIHPVTEDFDEDFEENINDKVELNTIFACIKDIDTYLDHPSYSEIKTYVKDTQSIINSGSNCHTSLLPKCYLLCGEDYDALKSGALIITKFLEDIGLIYQDDRGTYLTIDDISNYTLLHGYMGNLGPVSVATGSIKPPESLNYKTLYPVIFDITGQPNCDFEKILLRYKDRPVFFIMRCSTNVRSESDDEFSFGLTGYFPSFKNIGKVEALGAISLILRNPEEDYFENLVINSLSREGFKLATDVSLEEIFSTIKKFNEMGMIFEKDSIRIFERALMAAQLRELKDANYEYIIKKQDLIQNSVGLRLRNPLKKVQRKEKKYPENKIRHQEKAIEELYLIVDSILFDCKRIEKGLPPITRYHHSALLGNPGTFKTEGIKLLAKYFDKNGLFVNGIDDCFIIADKSTLTRRYLGETSQKISNLYRSLSEAAEEKFALLAIDEAYALLILIEYNALLSCVAKT